jgi:predicted small secreted protein
MGGSCRPQTASGYQKQRIPNMKRTQSFRIIIAAGLVATLLSACNTVKGAGRDVESVGRAGERVID